MNASKLTTEELRKLMESRLAEDPKYGRIAQRLRQLFWDDESNDINLKLYRRLQDEAIVHGSPVYRIIKSVAAAAQSKRVPVRYFCASVVRRLNEQGYLNPGEDDLGL